MLSTHFVAESEPQCIFGATLQSCLSLGLWRAQQGGQFWDVAGMKYWVVPAPQPCQDARQFWTRSEALQMLCGLAIKITG